MDVNDGWVEDSSDAPPSKKFFLLVDEVAGVDPYGSEGQEVDGEGGEDDGGRGRWESVG